MATGPCSPHIVGMPLATPLTTFGDVARGLRLGTVLQAGASGQTLPEVVLRLEQ